MSPHLPLVPLVVLRVFLFVWLPLLLLFFFLFIVLRFLLLHLLLWILIMLRFLLSLLLPPVQLLLHRSSCLGSLAAEQRQRGRLRPASNSRSNHLLRNVAALQARSGGDNDASATAVAENDEESHIQHHTAYHPWQRFSLNSLDELLSEIQQGVYPVFQHAHRERAQYRKDGVQLVANWRSPRTACAREVFAMTRSGLQP
mmetsp:Transcript_56014/g.158875  ORF Transcript_56014/g.158875 Transcript_56014/m.158875 type:complete len:200 (-) Transcript_56014:8-607(-)